ncbi:hypothetical protein SISNIDRAFT_448296 [Sistotremastrum niveocremeum HHB9708]|uniref:C2H2-type domain-containing protein n=1 Tax=Sistotremastrum niveocremeum HHB9708 TaxID=1314777 RepID=A0A164ZW24_9AGAM|nr:hypothetical protein SISNIDRAFT_448296 [Sistotremastrum niveocremeum HHB9708]
MARTKTPKQNSSARPRASKPRKPIDPTQRKPRAKKGSTRPEDGHVCPVCFKVYTRATDLVRHSRSHSDDPRPFKCEFEGCDGEFAQKGALEQHQRSGVHLDLQIYPCIWPGVKCSKTFNDPSSRSRHHYFIHGPGSHMYYYCGCGAKYRRPSGLKNHHDKKHALAGTPYKLPEPEPLRGVAADQVATNRELGHSEDSENTYENHVEGMLLPSTVDSSSESPSTPLSHSNVTSSILASNKSIPSFSTVSSQPMVLMHVAASPRQRLPPLPGKLARTTKISSMKTVTSKIKLPTSNSRHNGVHKYSRAVASPPKAKNRWSLSWILSSAEHV